MVVIDVADIPAIDSAVAHHLSQTVQAAGLMGTTTIISGMSSESALTLARLGIDLGGISTAGTLRDAVNELRAPNSTAPSGAPTRTPRLAGHAAG